MNDVSNLGRDGQPLDRDSRQHLFNLGNLLYALGQLVPRPSRPSIRCCRRAWCIPRVGTRSSPTCARPTTRSTRDTKAQIENLVAEHSLMYSRGSLGMIDYSDEERAMFRPVRQRLVRTHPVTGRKSLYLSSHAGGIVGLPMPEARLLLRDLTEHATQPRFVYAHAWRQWDLVMWDNRQMMHRGRRYDQTQPRDMRRTTVAGDAPTAAQVETT